MARPMPRPLPVTNTRCPDNNSRLTLAVAIAIVAVFLLRWRMMVWSSKTRKRTDVTRCAERQQQDRKLLSRYGEVPDVFCTIIPTKWSRRLVLSNNNFFHRHFRHSSDVSKATNMRLQKSKEFIHSLKTLIRHCRHWMPAHPRDHHYSFVVGVVNWRKEKEGDHHRCFPPRMGFGWESWHYY